DQRAGFGAAAGDAVQAAVRLAHVHRSPGVAVPLLGTGRPAGGNAERAGQARDRAQFGAGNPGHKAPLAAVPHLGEGVGLELDDVRAYGHAPVGSAVLAQGTTPRNPPGQETEERVALFLIAVV